METAYSSRKVTIVNSPSLKIRPRTERTIHKSKTTSELTRKGTTHIKEIYTLSRLLPRNINQDKEKLFEENMRLKLQSNDILGENIQLRTRVKKLESRKHKYDQSEPGLALVASLKQNIKELKVKLGEKEEEVHSLRKNIRTCKLDELEMEIKTYQEECSRLTSHLNEFMKMKDIPNSYLEYENKIFIKTQAVNKMKKEMQDTQYELNQVREENGHLKDKLLVLEKKNKKPSPRSLEMNILRDEYENLKILQKATEESFLEREKKLIIEIENVKSLHQEDLSKLKNLEKNLEERFFVIQGLQKQLSYLKSEQSKPQDAISFPNSPSGATKLSQPPRAFIKINEIAKEKHLLVSVFLSLLDKNNNGLIDSVEFRKGILLHGRYLKQKHVDSLLALLGCGKKNIPIRSLEDLLEKYEYNDNYSSSSEEEVKEPTKMNIEKLRSKEVKPDPRYNEVVVPEITVVPNIAKEIEVGLVKVVEISDVMERIRLHMQERYFPKNRFLNVLFGNCFDPDTPVTADEIAEALRNNSVFLGSGEEIARFCRFLVEPEGIESMPASRIKVLKGKVLDFSKKLQKSIPDWNVFDRYRAQQQVYGIMASHKEEIHEQFNFYDKTCSGFIEIQNFRRIIEKYIENCDEIIQHLYLFSYSATKQLKTISFTDIYNGLDNWQLKILNLKTKHQVSIEKIHRALDTSQKTFEVAFGYDKEFLAGMDQVVSCLTALAAGIDDTMLSDINIGRYVCDLGLLKAMIYIEKSEDLGYISYSFS